MADPSDPFFFSLTLLTDAYGAQTAHEIWVHGSHLADQLGVW